MAHKIIRASHEENRPVKQDEYEDFMTNLNQALPQGFKKREIGPQPIVQFHPKIPTNRLIHMIERFEKQS